MNDIPALTAKLGVDYKEEGTTDLQLVGNTYMTTSAIKAVEAKKDLATLDANSSPEIVDYQASREILHKVAETGQKAMEELARLSRQTGEARSYEVLATMMKSLNDTAKTLREDTKKGHEAHYDTDKNGKVNIEKAVFVGSQSELLEQLKNVTEPKSVTIHGTATTKELPRES